MTCNKPYNPFKNTNYLLPFALAYLDVKEVLETQSWPEIYTTYSVVRKPCKENLEVKHLLFPPQSCNTEQQKYVHDTKDSEQSQNPRSSKLYRKY